MNTIPAFVVYPAIDLKDGQVVRLRQGDPDATTVFGADPAAVAARWAGAGAEWLHVVNLDGALGQQASTAELAINQVRLAEIASTVRILVQYGGGIRSLEDIEQALQLGADRVVLGTMAVKHPARVGDAVREFGSASIVVALDARDGFVATHGWRETSALRAAVVAARMKELGVVRLLYTDVARDGMLSGADVAGTASLARESGLRVIASGGVASLSDVAALARCDPQWVEGAIIGQALYSGALHLDDVLATAREALCGVQGADPLAGA